MKKNLIFCFMCCLWMFSSIQAYGQQLPVRGTVTDASGEPLPGVNIVVKGTTTGTVTNSDGEYSLTVSSGDVTLVYNFIGFRYKEIAVDGQKQIDVVMEEENIGLDEVVVVGYGVQRKGDLTGAVSTVSGDEMLKGVTPNLTSNLAGKLTGVSAMTRSGKPGAENVDMMIRGKSTFSDGNNSPLILVDGIERGMNRINPNDIESITILKDAASAAIYGVKGANGVIIITTKRGKEGVSEITYSYNYGIQTPKYVPEMMNSYEYATHLNEALVNDGNDPQYSEEEIEAFKNGTAPDTDWWSTVMEDKASIQTHNLTISNGNEKVSYRTSFEYLDQNGLYELSNYKRYNFRANIDGQITDNLSMSVNLAGRVDERQEATEESNFFKLMTESRPTEPPYIMVNGEQELNWNGFNLSPIGQGLFSGYDRRKTTSLQSQASLRYDVPFVDGLFASYTYSFDRDFRGDKEFKTSYEYYKGSPDNVFVTPDGLTQEFSERTRQTGQFVVNYDQSFGGHNLGGMFVFEHSDYSTEFIEAFRDGFISSAIDQMFAGSTARASNDGGASEVARLGYATRLNYNYMGKYLVQLNARYDKSFLFDKENAGGLFPAASVGWRISDEPFMAGLSALSDLKIRGGFGIYGNDRIGKYQYLSTYSFSNTGTILGRSSSVFHTAISPDDIPNRSVTWEEAKMFNAGFDFGLFRNKISGDFEVFTKTTDNLLIKPRDIPKELGTSIAEKNIGSVKNKGFEASLKYREQFGDLLFSVQGNVTYATSEIIEMSEPENVAPGLRQTGRPFDSRYGYVSLGFFQDADEIANSPDQTTQFGKVNPGDIKYKDLNNDGVINEQDRTYIGRGGLPELMFGGNLYFAYKGFELTTNFTGGSRYTREFRMHTFTNEANTLAIYTDAWTPDNPDAKYPANYIGKGSNNNARSDFWLEEGWFVKLQNAEFAYNVPQIGALTQIGLNNLRLSVSGNNLLTFSNLEEFDPEASDVTGHPFYYIQMKSVNFGLRATF